MERAIDKYGIDKKIKPLLALWDIISKVRVKLPTGSVEEIANASEGLSELAQGLQLLVTKFKIS